METTGTWWRWHRGRFPAGDSLPLDRRSSPSTLPTEMAFDVYSEYEDSYRLEIQGPRDERDLGECLESPLSLSTNMNEAEYGSTCYHGMTIQPCVHVPPETEMVRQRRRRRRPMPSAVPPEKEEAPATMALCDERGGKDDEQEEEEDEEKEEQRRDGAGSTLPKSGSGPRRPRQKGKWWPLLNHFGSASCFRDLCSSRKLQKRGPRKNNEHWTPEEVKLLVDGVSELGVGHWSEMKDRWFSDSVRDAVHLKDKWRNLLKAHTVRPASKKKVNAPLDKDVIKKIQRLAADNPCPK